MFRKATIADIPAIVALVESAYRGDASRVGWTTEADLLEGQRIDTVGVAEQIATPGSRVILAERHGELLACCYLEKQDEVAFFGMFSVAPNLQSQGVGKQLLAEAEHQAKIDLHCSRMQMTVIDIRDTLVAFYERRGYRRTGVFKPFPYGDERFGIPKRDDLRFEILEKLL